MSAPSRPAAFPTNHCSGLRKLATAFAFGSVLLLAALQPGQLGAQQGVGIPIQLPTQSFFGVNTTVSVPDGGSISLGGNSGSAWSSTRRGFFGPPFANRASGGTQFANNASVHVQIISLSEMEAELLSQLPPDRSWSDYLRPVPPKLWVRQQEAALETSLSSSTSRQTSRSASTNGVQLASPPTLRTGPQRRTTAPAHLVDPNGSQSVQDKADFMSRHIGRKKK